jgi:hypothetical protein
MMERCLKWCDADEGKIFWRWLEHSLKQSVAGAERYLGAHEMEKIIKANKMKANQQTYGWVGQFAERLKVLIAENKNNDIELTDINDM